MFRPLPRLRGQLGFLPGWPVGSYRASSWRISRRAVNSARDGVVIVFSFLLCRETKIGAGAVVAIRDYLGFKRFMRMLVWPSHLAAYRGIGQRRPTFRAAGQRAAVQGPRRFPDAARTSAAAVPPPQVSNRMATIGKSGGRVCRAEARSKTDRRVCPPLVPCRQSAPRSTSNGVSGPAHPGAPCPEE
jgi:hypothetical protein